MGCRGVWRVLLGVGAVLCGNALNPVARAACPAPSTPRVTQRTVRLDREAAELDSAVSQRNYQFLPVTMEWLSGGGLQYLTNYYYYLALHGNRFQMHLPVAVGRTSLFNAMADIQSDSVSDYTLRRLPAGWKISFSVLDGAGQRRGIVLTIDSATSRTMVDLLTPHNIMQYTGTLVPNRGVPHLVDPAPLLPAGRGAAGAATNRSTPLLPSWE